VRCSPSIFNKLQEQLTISQSRKIEDLKFGCLLQFSAEMPDNSDILVYLMDKLNPETMILEVGDEDGLQINDLCVNKVLDIPRGKKDPPSSTEEENESALAQFRRSVRVDSNMDVKCKHLLQLILKLFINNDLAVRIFFMVAFNKLFPAVGNNVKGKDAFMTMDVSDFPNVNWCKVVVDEIRHSAIAWRSEKKKSIPGCALFLIVSLSSPLFPFRIHILFDYSMPILFFFFS
jgi:hypothetical protein